MFKLHGYDLKEKIYESENTIVYRATRQIPDNSNQVQNTSLVIKTFSNNRPSANQINNLKYSYEIIRELDIEGIIQHFGIEKSGNNYALLMEDTGGKSLKELFKGKGLDLEEFFKISLSLVDSLGKLHASGLIHKDINPGNIIYNKSTGSIKYTDFETATKLSREQHGSSLSDKIVGTLPYMSPEQTGRMNRDIDYRSDYYSLGITFYELLTGTLPFKGDDHISLVHSHIAKIPNPPDVLRPEIPKMLSSLVLKLLSKNAEDRYQSSTGLKRDLELCSSQWSSGIQKNFELGSHDISERFELSRKIYGRDTELNLLNTSYNNVLKGNKEIFLVDGAAGTGKTTLINELLKSVSSGGGYFISGKYDSLGKDKAYSGIIQALTSLVRQILSENDTSLSNWKSKILKYIGTNGSLIINIIPDLEKLLGQQPDLNNLGPQESRNRFNYTLREVFKAFCSKEHPLIMFLDDLQWGDSATFELLEFILSDNETGNLFLVGTYRTEEINKFHSLNQLTDKLKTNGINVNNLYLEPLKQEDVSNLISDTLMQKGDEVNELTDLLYKKTGGNPFYLNELLYGLYREKVFSFDLDRRMWTWDKDKVRELDVTENIADFLFKRLDLLSSETREILKYASCIGNNFRLSTLSFILQKSPSYIANKLWEVLKEGLLLVAGGKQSLLYLEENQSSEIDIKYKFSHDKIQSAFYSLIPDSEKARTHLSIGRILKANLNAVDLDKNLISVVNHFNAGIDLIADEKERIELSDLNRRSAIMCKNANAYDLSYEYLINSSNLLSGNKWEKYYEIMLNTVRELCEVSFLRGDYEKLEKFSNELISNTANIYDQIQTYQLLIIYHFYSRHDADKSLSICVNILKKLGVKLNPKPGQLDIIRQVMKAKFSLRKKSLKYLEEKQNTTDKRIMAIQSICHSGSSVALNTGSNFYPIFTSLVVETSVKHGYSNLSTPTGFSGFAMIHIIAFQDYEKADYFANLALKLIERPDQSNAREEIIHICYSFVLFYRSCSLKECLDKLWDVSRKLMLTGRLEYCSYALLLNYMYRFHTGENLKELLSNFGTYYENTKDYAFTQAMIDSYHLVMRTLSLKENTSLLNNSFKEKRDNTLVESIYGITYMYEGFILFLIKDYRQAYIKYNEAQKYDKINMVIYDGNLYKCYQTLTLLALYEKASFFEKRKFIKIIKKNFKRFHKLSKSAPVNFENKYLLMQAEFARVKGDVQKASKLYDKAIDSSQKNGFIHEEAISNELAGDFYLTQGLKKIATTYFIEAIYLYERWGSDFKTEDLKLRHKDLLSEQFNNDFSNTKKTEPLFLSSSLNSASDYTSSKLDIETVMKASRTISSEIDLKRFIEKMMGIIIENSGAQRGLLVLESGGAYYVEAEIDTEDKTNVIFTGIPFSEHKGLSHSIVQYVLRTSESIYYSLNQRESQFYNDPYILSISPKSILCTPIIRKNNIVGLVYLENRITDEVFTSERKMILQLLLSQSAISLENAFVYKHLDELVKQRTAELEQAQKEALDNAQRAGQLDIATSILHNVGNVLTSVVSSGELIKKNIDNSSLHKFKEVNKLLREHRNNLPDFILNDPKGIKLLEYYLKLEEALSEENNQNREYSKRLLEKIGVIRDIVVAQQDYAIGGFNNEEYKVKDLIENALALQSAVISRHGLNIIKNYDKVPDVLLQKTKFIHVVINILNNAKEAMFSVKKEDKKIFIDLSADKDNIYIRFKDTGTGIPNDQLKLIFRHGFTTKKDGHGFGLHSCANYMTEMGGKIWAESEGKDKGATFILQFPLRNKN